MDCNTICQVDIISIFKESIENNMDFIKLYLSWVLVVFSILTILICVGAFIIYINEISITNKNFVYIIGHGILITTIIIMVICGLRIIFEKKLDIPLGYVIIGPFVLAVYIIYRFNIKMPQCTPPAPRTDPNIRIFKLSNADIRDINSGKLKLQHF